MRVRYEGPAQGIALLHHSLRQFGVTVTSTTTPPERATLDEVVSVVVHVSGGSDDAQLARDVQTALRAFATLYHRAALDLIEG